MNLADMSLEEKVEMYQSPRVKECHLPLVPVTTRNPSPKRVRCRVIELSPGFRVLKIELLDIPNCGKKVLVSPRVLDCGRLS